MDISLWPYLTLTNPLPVCYSITRVRAHTHTHSLEFRKPSQTPFFCPSVRSKLTRGWEGPDPWERQRTLLFGSQQCGKRQTGSSKDDQWGLHPCPHLTPRLMEPQIHWGFLRPCMTEEVVCSVIIERHTRTQTHLKRHTRCVSLAVSSFHSASVTLIVPLLLYHYIADASSASLATVLSTVIVAIWTHFIDHLPPTVWASDTG